MEYCLNRRDEPIFMAVSKPLLTEFGIHYRLESCANAFYGSIFCETILCRAVQVLPNELFLIQIRKHFAVLGTPAANWLNY